MKKVLLTLLCVLGFAIGASAAQISTTVVKTDLSTYPEGLSNYDGAAYDVGNATISASIGEGSSYPYYVSYSMGFYKNNTLSIAAKPGESVTRIEFEWSGASFTPAEGQLEVSSGTYDFSNHSWTGAAPKVTFTFKQGSGNRRILSFVIYTTAYDSVTDLAAPSVTVNGGPYANPVTVGLFATQPGASIFYATGDDAFAPYTEPLTFTTHTTLKAKTQVNGVDSPVDETVYRIFTDYQQLPFSYSVEEDSRYSSGLGLEGLDFLFGDIAKMNVVRNGSNSNPCMGNSGGKILKVYKLNTVTFTANKPTDVISKIVFHCTSGSSYGFQVSTTANTGEIEISDDYATATWTGAANEVKFSIGGSTYVYSIDVYYYMQDPIAPKFGLEPGNYIDEQTVELTTPHTSGATIYYTLDGSEPTTESTAYTESIVLAPHTFTTIKAMTYFMGKSGEVVEGLFNVYDSQDLKTVTLKAADAKAVKGYKNESELTTEDIEGLVSIDWGKGTATEPPYFYSGTFRLRSGNNMTVKPNKEGNIITGLKFKTPSSNPFKAADVVNSGKLDVSNTTQTTWEGIAPEVKIDKLSSGIAYMEEIEVTLLTELPENPVFELAPTSYVGTQSLELSNPAPNVAIYYTTDGTEPTVESTLYTEPILVDRDMTVKAVAYKYGNYSEVITGEYVIIDPNDVVTLTLNSVEVKPIKGYMSNHALTTEDLEGLVSVEWIQGEGSQAPYFYSNCFDIVPGNSVKVKTVSPNNMIQHIKYTTESGHYFRDKDYTEPAGLGITSTTEANWNGLANEVEVFRVWDSKLYIEEIEITLVLRDVLPPVPSLVAGPYIEDQTVALGCTTPAVNIYYTTDGSEPTTESTLYTEPILVDRDMTIKAIAEKKGNVSEVAEFAYRIFHNPQIVTTEVYSFLDHKADYPAGNASIDGLTVDLGNGFSASFATGEGANYPYVYTGASTYAYNKFYKDNKITFFGNDPQAVITRIELLNYNQGFNADPTANVGTAHKDDDGNAIWEGSASSVTLTNTGGTVNYNRIVISYILQKVVAPEFSLDPNQIYKTAQQVEITCENWNSNIYYTLDGSEPTTESTLYTEPITISEPTTIKAIGELNGVTGPVAEAFYNVLVDMDVVKFKLTAADLKALYGESITLDEDVKINEYVSLAFSNNPYFYQGSSTNDPYLRHDNNKIMTVKVANEGDVISHVKVTSTYYLPVTAAPQVAIGTTTSTLIEDEKDERTYGVWEWDGAAPEIEFKNIQGSNITMGEIEVTYMLNGMKVPVGLPKAGTYVDELPVDLWTVSPGADIYYTLDGTTPTNASTRYTEPFTITADAQLRVVSEKRGAYSAVAAADYTIVAAEDVVGFELENNDIREIFGDNTNKEIPGVALNSDVNLLMEKADGYTYPFYSLNNGGSLYSVAGNKYTFTTVRDIPVVDENEPQGAPARVNAEANNMLTCIKLYTSDTYGSSTEVSNGNFELKHDGANKLHWLEWTGYSDEVSIKEPKNILHIKRIEVQYATAIARPYFSDEEGDYDKGIDISIYHKDPAAVIYYTLDGSTPTVDSTLYTDPIILNETTTIKAIAVVGNKVSPVATATYNICDVLDGFDNIAIDSIDAADSYFDLRGVRVSNPKAGEVYIRVTDGKAAKVLVK